MDHSLTQTMKKTDRFPVNGIRTFPIPIHTNHGIVHLYCKEQQPIIGTNMTESRFAIIIVTETKKYCGFLSEKDYKVNNYSRYPDERSGQYSVLVNKSQCSITEEQLIALPSERMKPFNLSEGVKSITIDYVSFCAMNLRLWRTLDDRQVPECGKIVNINYGEITKIHEKLIVRFQLKAHEYESYDQSIESVTAQTFENNPKLEFMLKKIWQDEQGIAVILHRPLSSDPPKYDEEVEKKICENTDQ